MAKDNENKSHSLKRRQRLHELLIALIQKQENFELMDVNSPSFESNPTNLCKEDLSELMLRNRRILSKYQSLVRSAITLDALVDSEKIDSV